MLVEKKERREEGTKVDAQEQVLARIWAPSASEHDTRHVGDQESAFADDVRIGLVIEPGRTPARAERQGQPTVPATIEPVSLTLRTCRRAKRGENEHQADHHA